MSHRYEAGRPDVDSTEAGTPRWVKISWIIAAIIVVVIVAALFFGGEHGLSRHGGPQDGARTVSVVVRR